MYIIYMCVILYFKNKIIFAFLYDFYTFPYPNQLYHTYIFASI